MKYIKKFDAINFDINKFENDPKQYLYRIISLKKIFYIIDKFKEFDIDFKLFKLYDNNFDLGYQYFILFTGYYHDAWEIMNNSDRVQKIPKGYKEMNNIEQELIKVKQELDMIKYNL